MQRSAGKAGEAVRLSSIKNQMIFMLRNQVEDTVKKGAGKIVSQYYPLLGSINFSISFIFKT